MVMKKLFLKFILLSFAIIAAGCKEDLVKSNQRNATKINQIKYAKGLAIYKYKGFSILSIKNPWPNATEEYTYILKEKTGVIPDSLREFPIINIPLKKIVVTSTTHIPSLEMLDVENTLIGFPHTDYISSEKVRKQIDNNKIKDVGSDQSLNTELLIELAPDALVGHGIDNNNPTFDQLQKNGLKVIINGDWNESTPLGKAEWIKFFGALYNLDSKANAIFESIETNYKTALSLAKKAINRPTVFSGAIYENQWYMPQGASWGAIFLQDANANYLWKETKGTGSLSLSFESVLLTADNADFWIGPGQFTSLAELSASNPHYTQFKAYKTKNIYSYSTKKGKTGGIIYYELAPNRPDLVLKDLVKIMHPEMLPDYKLYFFEKLK
jgi:iron complex transport system substrate-binding protein